MCGHSALCALAPPEASQVICRNIQAAAEVDACLNPCACRRISATSVAARVAAERGEALGRTVGYAIRMESNRSAHTRLLLCTTGMSGLQAIPMSLFLAEDSTADMDAEEAPA